MTARLKRLKTKQRQSIAVGSWAPPFTLCDPLSGAPIGLADYTGKDILLIFFRGTWCPFCREQMRFLAQNFEKLQKADIVVLGVVCQSTATLRGYLEANPLPFPLLSDESRVIAKSYGVHYWLSWEGINLARPAVFIIGRDSRVMFTYIGRNMADLPVHTIVEKFLTFLD
jgi:peroxiredoxin Q/BCP